MGTAPNKSVCILCYINDMKSAVSFIIFPSIISLVFLLIQSLSLFSPFLLHVFLFFLFLPTIFYVLPFLFYFLLLRTFVSIYFFFFFLFIFLLLPLVSFISHSPSLMFFHFSWYPLLFLSLHHFISFTLLHCSLLWTHTP